jgi:hypothetical protein
MEIAYLTYEHVSYKPEGMPIAWPAEVLEVADGSSPPAVNWQVVSVAAFAAYVATHQASYDAWDLENKREKSMNYTRKLKVKKYSQDFAFPSDVNRVSIKNTGQLPVDIRFDNDKKTDSLQVDVGEKLPTLKVLGGTTILRHESSFDGELQLLMWSE